MDVAKRIHRLPEAVVPVRAQLAVGRQAYEWLPHEEHVIALDPIQDPRLLDNKAPIHRGAIASGFSWNARTPIATTHSTTSRRRGPSMRHVAAPVFGRLVVSIDAHGIRRIWKSSTCAIGMASGTKTLGWPASA